MNAMIRSRHTPLILLCVFILAVLAAGCESPLALFATRTPTITSTATGTATATFTLTPSPTTTDTPTLTSTNTYTPTITDTPTITPTPSRTPTPTITPTPTFDFPDVIVLMQAHCRYGPGQAYLHAADLAIGDRALVHNRNWNGTWLFILPEKINYHCWVSTSVVEVEGDIWSVVEYDSPLPWSVLYGPPEAVYVERQGDNVIVTWEPIWMTEDDDRGYMIEANVCSNGLLIPVALHTMGTKLTVYDPAGCDMPSNGVLYAVEKHGYTESITVPWIQHPDN